MSCGISISISTFSMLLDADPGRWPPLPSPSESVVDQLVRRARSWNRRSMGIYLCWKQVDSRKPATSPREPSCWMRLWTSRGDLLPSSEMRYATSPACTSITNVPHHTQSAHAPHAAPPCSCHSSRRASQSLPRYVSTPAGRARRGAPLMYAETTCCPGAKTSTSGP